MAHRKHDPVLVSVHGRGEVDKLAPRDWAAALVCARQIPDGWYRAQALATVAEHAPKSAVLALLDESVEAANTCPDAYGMVAVMSWPLQVSYKRRQPGWALRARDRAIALAPHVQPLASRAFAMQCLWGGCYAGGPQYAEPVWQAILALCPPDRSWRAARLYRHVAEIREHYEPRSGAARAVLDAMPVEGAGETCTAAQASALIGLRRKARRSPASSLRLPML